MIGMVIRVVEFSGRYTKLDRFFFVKNQSRKILHFMNRHSRSKELQKFNIYKMHSNFNLEF